MPTTSGDIILLLGKLTQPAAQNRFGCIGTIPMFTNTIHAIDNIITAIKFIPHHEDSFANNAVLLVDIVVRCMVAPDAAIKAPFLARPDKP